MSKSQETSTKKEVRNKKEKKRKEKEQKRLAKKESVKSGSMDNMIAYVDENGVITSTPPDPLKKKKVKLEDIEVSIPKQDSVQKLDPKRKGIVTFYNESKGFGFIKDSETKERVFVHVNNITEEIKEGNAVSFDFMPGKRGPAAVNVKLIKP